MPGSVDVDHGYPTDPARQCEARTKDGHGRRCLNHPLRGRPRCYIHMGPLAEWDPAEVARRVSLHRGATRALQIGPSPA